MHKDVAVKKVVQPTLVQLRPPVEGVRPPVGGVGPPGEEETRESVASAAAVAAVSAVIATQPFIKVRNKLNGWLHLCLGWSRGDKRPKKLCVVLVHISTNTRGGTKGCY